MPPVVHPGRLLKRELDARGLSANRLALALGVPSGRITDILNGRRSITAETAVRLGHYFGNRPGFWLALQSQYDIALVERDRGAEIASRRRNSQPGAAGGRVTLPSVRMPLLSHGSIRSDNMAPSLRRANQSGVPQERRCRWPIE